VNGEADMDCAFYPGSFDPPTLGHLDIMRRGLKLADKLVLGVGVHPTKTPMFSDAERVAMLQEELRALGADSRNEVVLFQGLTVDAAQKCGAKAILRGLRDAGDFSYEMQLSGMNRQLAPDIDTVFLAASPEVSHITATLVRQIASLGGDVSRFVSPAVFNRIQNKFRGV
jgi:pantetheine-phosphate adenylyltransferase